MTKEYSSERRQKSDLSSRNIPCMFEEHCGTNKTAFAGIAEIRQTQISTEIEAGNLYSELILVFKKEPSATVNSQQKGF